MELRQNLFKAFDEVYLSVVHRCMCYTKECCSASDVMKEYSPTSDNMKEYCFTSDNMKEYCTTSDNMKKCCTTDNTKDETFQIIFFHCSIISEEGQKM